MNRAYKLVWNTVSNSWIVASELAKGHKKSSSTALKLVLGIATVLSAGIAHAAPAANALPTGEVSLVGAIAFDRSTPNQLSINQSTAYGLTFWNSFDVGQDAKVVINQPTSNSYSLNQVNSGVASEIFGKVESNGHFILANQAGITFGAGSQVNAAAIVATANPIITLSNANNLYSVNAATAGATVANYGTLAASAGDVTLLAPRVVNAGTISAAGGNVNLMNADTVTFNNSVPSITSNSSVTGFIQNSGNITATQVSSVGGKILLTGEATQAASQIQLAGTLDATTNTSVNGRSIVVNGDVNLNGASNVLDFTASDGYSLTNAAQLNLNGASSGFSVNGTAYTVIRDVTQLQAMSSNLSGKYVLAADIDASDTVNWNGGSGFVPVGTAASKFNGVLDGLGHSISQLKTSNNLQANGLFGVVGNSTIQNLLLKDAAITGGTYNGLLIGQALNSVLSVNNVLVTGSLTSASTTSYSGGLIGYASFEAVGTNTLNIGNVYANVTMNNINRSVAGGLIGGVLTNSSSTIASSVNIQDVSTSGAIYGVNAGGIVGGYQSGSSQPSTLTINRVYTDASITGTNSPTIANALVGGAYMAGAGAAATISNSYWNATTTGKSNVIYGAAGTYISNISSTQNVGLSDAQSKQLGSYTNWGGSIDAQAGTGSTWRIYEGYGAPLLRSFLKPLSSGVASDVTKTYDGRVASGVDFILDQAAGIDGSKILVDVNGGRNAGTYAVNTYSNQQGYDFTPTSGTLTINKANLTISSTDGSKTYDGTTSVSGVNAVAASGTQLFGTDTLTGGSFAFADKNAGTGKHVVVSGVTVNDGNNGDNYTVTYADNSSSSINKASLSISATDASKVYDGTTTARSSAIVTAGSLFGSDSLNGATFNYDDKNAGSGKHVIVSAAQISDGNNGGNYDVTYVDNTNSSISKRQLTISAVADSKEYDGKLTASATAKPVVVGRQRGDSIVGLTQSYLDKNAGTGKAINVDAGYTIRDGNGGNNYDVVVLNSNAGVITPKALTISTVANTKVYDGGVTSANKPLVTGLLTGDRVTGLFQQYETKTIGENKKLLIKAGYVVNDGNGGNNYSVTEQGSNDGVITAN